MYVTCALVVWRIPLKMKNLVSSHRINIFCSMTFWVKTMRHCQEKCDGQRYGRTNGRTYTRTDRHGVLIKLLSAAYIYIYIYIYDAYKFNAFNPIYLWFSLWDWRHNNELTQKCGRNPECLFDQYASTITPKSSPFMSRIVSKPHDLCQKHSIALNANKRFIGVMTRLVPL